MQCFANPPLRHIIRRSFFAAASKRQCLQYLRALRTLHLNILFLGETYYRKSYNRRKNSQGDQPVLAGMDTFLHWQQTKAGALEVQTAIKR